MKACYDVGSCLVALKRKRRLQLGLSRQRHRDKPRTSAVVRDPFSMAEADPGSSRANFGNGCSIRSRRLCWTCWPFASARRFTRSGSTTTRARQPRFVAADQLAKAVNLDMADWWTPTGESYLGRVKKEQILEAIRRGDRVKRILRTSAS